MHLTAVHIWQVADLALARQRLRGAAETAWARLQGGIARRAAPLRALVSRLGELECLLALAALSRADGSSSPPNPSTSLP